MEFEFIDYKILKTKKILRHDKLLFIFSNTRLKSKNWLLVEQALKLAKLKYYKIYNIIANRIIENSIFRNNRKLMINCSTLFSTFDQKCFIKKNENNQLFLLPKLTNVHLLLSFLFAKINNKLYTNFQTKKLKFPIYKTNLLIFSCLFKKTIKNNFLTYF